MTPEIKAIETSYKGYRFRSRLEARWAVVFDALGIRWQYEHEGYELPSGKRYLPDFYLPDMDLLVEVKGTVNDAQRKMVVLCGCLASVPPYMSIYGDQALGLTTGRFPGIEARNTDFADCFLMWFDESWFWAINEHPGRALWLAAGMHLEIVRSSGKPLYLSSDAQIVIDAFNWFCSMASINIAGSVIAKSIKDAANLLFPCGEEQRKLCEAGQALHKKAMMLIGALHEHEAELFDPNGWSDVSSCWEDTVETLTGKVNPELAYRSLRAGMEARF